MSFFSEILRNIFVCFIEFSCSEYYTKRELRNIRYDLNVRDHKIQAHHFKVEETEV